MAKSNDVNGDATSSEMESDETISLTQRSPSIAVRAYQRALHAFVDGDVVAERYRIVRFIAKGGMGEVYEAEDQTLGGQLALKTIRGEAAGDVSAMERFKREIHLARKVTHPNICRIYDIGSHPLPEIGGEVTFLTMEMLPGQTLSERIAAGRLAPAEALPIVEQIAAGLDAAHTAGVVHRDFKSSNIMLSESAERPLRTVITDFGLARGASKDPGLVSISASGQILGTPAYMAPEQVEGHEATAAADIYALGIVLYEMVTGKRPFDGGSAISVAARRLTEPPPPPRSFVPDLDPNWEAVILRCLERDPTRRFASVLEIPETLAGDLVKPDAPITRTPLTVRMALLAGALIVVATASYVLRGTLWPTVPPPTVSPPGSQEVTPGAAARLYSEAIEARQQAIDGDWQAASATYLALYEAYPGDVDVALQLADAQMHNGQTRQAQVTLGEIRKLPAAENDPRVDLYQAMALYNLGELQQAQGLARQAAVKAETAGASLLKAKARIVEAKALQDLGESPQATLAEARALFEAGGDRRGVAETLELTALTVLGQGELDGARRLYDRALVTYREISDRKGVARVRVAMGSILLDQGRLEEAEKLHRQALTTFQELGAKLEATSVLIDIGYKLHVQGELERALAAYQEALVLTGELGDQPGSAVTLTNIAEVYYLRGDLDLARQMHEEALAINREIGDSSGVAYDTYRLGKVFAARGDHFVARGKYEQALALQTEMGETIAAAQTRAALAELTRAEGDAAAAESLARQAEEVLRTEGVADEATLARSTLARCLLAQGKLEASRKVAEDVRAAAETSQDRRVRLAAAITGALVRASTATEEDVAAALSELDRVAAEATEKGFAGYRREARQAAEEIAASTRRTE